MVWRTGKIKQMPDRRGEDSDAGGRGVVPRTQKIQQIQVGGKNSDEEGGGDDTKNRED
jgi:hypothetical protein